VAPPVRKSFAPPPAVRVLRWDPPPSNDSDLRLTLFEPRPPASPRTNAARKPAPIGLCNRLPATCTCRSDDSRLEETARAVAHARRGSHPAEQLGSRALDDAPRASVGLLHAPARIRAGAGAPRILGALDRRALEALLSSAALSSADEKRGTAYDAPLTSNARPRPGDRRQNRLRRGPVKTHDL